MVLRAGYKDTAAGVIPSNWEAKPLGTIAKIYRGASPRPIENPIWFDEASKIGWVRISDVTKSRGRLHETDQKLSSLGIAHSRFIPKESLIMSICATVGKPIVTEIDVCIHDGFVVFENLRIDRDFLLYILNFIESDWSKNGQTGSQMNLNTGIISSKFIPVPLDKAEQESIAMALSDADALIESLERLIAKKRQIKQGAMRDLLTGTRRLPGFTAEWIPKLIGQLLQVRHGRSQKSVEDSNGDIPILASGGRIGTANSCIYDKPSVLIGRKGTINKPQFTDRPFWTVDTLFYTEIASHTSPKFIYYRFCLIDWMAHNEASGVPSLNAKTIESILISMPPLIEQAAIATILSDMDAELAALDTKLTKARQIKQGMMHHLLTGDIRLV